MNDRFKFKHWDKQINKMRYGDIQLGNDGKPFVIVNNIENPIEEIEDVITLFSTGLKDKNGKLIYEGDILKTKTGLVKVVYFLAEFVLESIHNTDFLLIDWDTTEQEVIGNIYENPELLEV